MKTPAEFREGPPLDSQNHQNHPAPTAPTEDEAAELEAARHRYHASMLVRDHLESHVANNPGASSDYVTWIATLHPENADITIDPRFFVPGNPWWTIYEETKNEPIPTATAVPIPDSGSDDDSSSSSSGTDDRDDSDRSSDDKDGNTAEHASTVPQQGSDSDNESIARHRKPPHCCATCSPLQLTVAVLVAVPAIVGVLVCELSAFVVLYVPAALVYLTAKKLLSPPNCCTCGIYWALMLVDRVLYACDSIVLVVSVLLTEVVALAACLVGFCTGGALWAGRVHQQIRRICHGIRVFFRRHTTTTTTTTDSVPPRRFCGWTTTDQPQPHHQRQRQRYYESNNGAGATAEGSAVGSADHEHQRLYDV